MFVVLDSGCRSSKEIEDEGMLTGSQTNSAYMAKFCFELGMV